jgi:dipeptide/tripeptide permease
LLIVLGLFKSNVSPLLIDQNPHKRPYVSTLKSGERVIIDPEATVSRILLWFYLQVNVGAFFALATTYSEKRIGWWLAFLLPAIIYFMLPIMLAIMYKRTVKVKPTGNELTKVAGVIRAAIKQNGIMKLGSKNFLDAAKPSVSGNSAVGWNDKFVDDIKRTLVACQIFLFFPLFYINDNGIGSVQNSQGSTMTTNGAPNDLLSNFNPLAIIVFIPILNFGIYPLLRRYNIRFGRVSRITLGFALVAVNGLIGTILQYKVYTTSPCGYHATDCAEADGTVSPITIWSQAPIYVLGAIGECFANVTAYELAYSRSSPNMKSLVTSAFLFMNALSAAIGAAVTPAIADPNLIWVFAGPTIAGFLITPLFYFLYRDLDKEDESKMGLYDLPQDHARSGSVEGGLAPPSDEKRVDPEGVRSQNEQVARADLAPGAGTAPARPELDGEKPVQELEHRELK